MSHSAAQFWIAALMYSGPLSQRITCGFPRHEMIVASPNSLDALEAGVHDYVYYYNHERIKLGLQGLSPVQYRLRSTAKSAES